MSLFSTIKTFLNIASAQPNVLYYGEGNIYEALNGHQDVEYPAFFITQREHTETGDIISYGLDLFYIDRELSDKSNKLEVQSHAKAVLANIIRTASQFYDINSVIYHTFEERFDSICAGAYAEIVVEDVSDTACGYEYDDIEPASGVTPYVPSTKLQELSASTVEIQSDLQELSAYTATIASGITPDLSELSAQTSANTAQIEILSGTCGSLRTDLQTLSAYTATITGGTGGDDVILYLHDELKDNPDKWPEVYSAITEGKAVFLSWPQYHLMYLKSKIQNGEILFTQENGIYSQSMHYQSDGEMAWGIPQLIAPYASASEAGIILVGSGLTIDSGGTLSVDLSGYTTTAVTAELSAATSALSVQVQEIAVSAVTSETVRIIWTGSQAQYDIIDPKDPNTFYIITG